jgi:hypothetical protein
MVMIGILGGGPIGIEAALLAVRRGYKAIVVERGETVAANVVSWRHVQLFSPTALNISAEARAVWAAEKAAAAAGGSNTDMFATSAPVLADETAFLSGGEYVQHYLLPLVKWMEMQRGAGTASSEGNKDGKPAAAAAAADGHTGEALFELHLATRVVSVSRGKLFKKDDVGGGGPRADAPFRLLCARRRRRSQSQQRQCSASGTVIDGSTASTRVGDAVDDEEEEFLIEGIDFLLDATGTYGNHNWVRTDSGDVCA